MHVHVYIPYNRRLSLSSCFPPENKNDIMKDETPTTIEMHSRAPHRPISQIDSTTTKKKAVRLHFLHAQNRTISHTG